jgi:hypothetical protein
MVVLLFFAAAPEPVEAARATLAWNANQEDDLAGYKLYYGNGSRTYTANVNVGNTTSYTLTNLDSTKTYYFAVTAYNRSGAESGFSGEAKLAASNSGGGGGSDGGSPDDGSGSGGGDTAGGDSGGSSGDTPAGTPEGSTSTSEPTGTGADPGQTPSAESGGGGGGGGGCFIATAIYGPRSREVQILRDFRDNHLLTNRAGKQFVAAYYKYSPSIAAVIEKSETLRLIGKLLIAPIVSAVQHSYLFLMVIGAAVVFAVRRKVRKVRT